MIRRRCLLLLSGLLGAVESFTIHLQTASVGRVSLLSVAMGRPQEVVVSSIEEHALSPGSLRASGNFYRSSDDKALVGIPPNQAVAVCVVHGTAQSSQEPVLGFMPCRNVKGASTITVDSDMLLPLPVGLLGVKEACKLPLYAMALFAALNEAGIHEIVPESNVILTAVVTGASPQSFYAVQVLTALGYRVVACSRRLQQDLKAAGAVAVVDYSKESFCDYVQGSLAVVVDGLGVDADGLASALKRATGAAYISVMSASIRRMQQQGLLEGLGMFTSALFGKVQDPVCSAYWLPSKTGMDLMRQAVRLVQQSGIKIPVASPTINDYTDAITWPRDSESGLRFGFPSVDDAQLDDTVLRQRYMQGKLKEEVEVPGSTELVTALSWYGSSFKRVGGDDNANDASRLPTVVFVSSPSCKVCQALKPKVSQVAREFPGVRFFSLVVGPENYQVAEYLRVRGYPSFLGYHAAGSRVFEHTAFDAKLIQMIFTMVKRQREGGVGKEG